MHSRSLALVCSLLSLQGQDPNGKVFEPFCESEIHENEFKIYKIEEALCGYLKINYPTLATEKSSSGINLSYKVKTISRLVPAWRKRPAYYAPTVVPDIGGFIITIHLERKGYPNQSQFNPPGSSAHAYFNKIDFDDKVVQILLRFQSDSAAPADILPKVISLVEQALVNSSTNS